MKRTLWAALTAPALAAAVMSVSVSASASPAGSPPAAPAASAMARFDHQRIAWHGCFTGSDDPEGQALDQAGAQCAGITVPLDYARPGGRTITIAISRLKATDTAHQDVPGRAGRLGGLGRPPRWPVSPRRHRRQRAVRRAAGLPGGRPRQ